MTYLSLFESIAKAIKSKDELSMVTCIYSNSREISQNPVCGFTLSFEAGKTRHINATQDSEIKEIAEVKLCLLAPLGAGGKRLCEVAEWIAEAIRDDGSSEVYTEIVISKPSYNETASVLSTDITVIYSREAVSEPEIKFYVDGIYIDRMVSFSAERKVKTEKLDEQLLNGCSTVDMVYYSLKLSVEVPLKNISGEFNLRIDSPEGTEEYKRCTIKSFNHKYLATDKMIYSYDIETKDRTA